MGASTSTSHNDSFSIDRFKKSITTLKSCYNSTISDDNDLMQSIQRYYTGIDLNNDDHTRLDLLNTNIEKVIDSVKYYLTYYQKAQTQNNSNNSKYTDYLIENCNQDSCVFNPCDTQQQIHFILSHPSKYNELSRRRLYHFTFNSIHFTYQSTTETENNTVNIFVNNISDINIHHISSDSDSNTSESKETEYFKHDDAPKTMPNKALPETPMHMITNKQNGKCHINHNKTRSLNCFTQLKNCRNRDVYNRQIHKSKSKSPPPIPHNKPLPLPRIKPSTTSSKKIENESASENGGDHAPILHRNENHNKELIIKSAQELPSNPPKPRRIKKKRSKTVKISEKTNKQILEGDKYENNHCIAGDKCIRLRVFLSTIQGHKLIKDDVKKGTFNDNYYKHCRKYHNEYKGKCDTDINECIWNEDNKSEIYIAHGHYFHNNYKTKKVKYKQTLSLLLQNNKKYSNLKQLDFGYKFDINQKCEALFKNPKQEILHNKYNPLINKEWNDLLKKTIYYVKQKEAKRISLSMKEILCLKLYTDFDALQRNFRKCFRDKNKQERRQRQRSFYHWYKCIVGACNKSKDIISCRIYHGVDIQLPPSTFFGVYHGPVSTTTNWDIAAGFAGNAGQVIELYPSFGKKGLNVSFLSNFPEEKEILYIDCSFQIANIFKCDAVEIGLINPSILSYKEIQTVGIKSVQYMEHCIIKAIQMISVNSQVISLNMNNMNNMNNTCIGFNTLQAPEKICILYLLYLQYRVKEWKIFCQQSADYIHIALAKFRDMFISLVTNVKAVRMEKLSKLLQIFFYTKQEDYKFPINIISTNEFKMDDIKQYEQLYIPKQPLKFETICLLFPNAKQISINSDNWDFSLNIFIQFLQIFDLNYANVALQDIYIRFVAHDGKIMNDERRARKLRKHYTNFNMNLRKLRKLGWSLVSPSHLHRVGFEPLPELPFLRLFVPPQKDTLAPILFRTYSTRFSIATYLSELQKDEFKNLLNEGEGEEVGELEDRNIVLVDHNPKNVILSNDVFGTLKYKNKLIKLLKWRKNDKQAVFATDQIQKRFVICCYMVKVIVLDPLPNELNDIFCIEKNNNKKRISFVKICAIFPNVEDIFLRNTTFNLSILYPFLEFIKNSKKSVCKEIKLERIFFSKEKPMKHRDLIPIKNQLNNIGWDFVEYEQTVFKTY